MPDAEISHQVHYDGCHLCQGHVARIEELEDELAEEQQIVDYETKNSEGWEKLYAQAFSRIKELERELTEAEEQLVAQWTGWLTCPCGARSNPPWFGNSQPHTPNCPTARALDRLSSPNSEQG